MTEYSAGGVITKKEGGRLLVLLVEHIDGTFVFPKGHIEQDETFEEAAKREIREEVGLENVVIGEKLGIIRRKPIKQEGKPAKEITMFRVEDKDYSHLQNSQESYSWFDLEEVDSHLRYEEDRLFFQSIRDSLRNN